MDYIGIDIGSTSAKMAVLGEHIMKTVIPTGWSSREAAENLAEILHSNGVNLNESVVYATGYGRNAVAFAKKTVTEITCHAKGGSSVFGGDCTILDVGGQDTKVIAVKNGMVEDFLMNDKCSAGTGKFVEVMANRLNVSIDELFRLAAQGTPLPISSLCTVFAESEIISHIGEGRAKEDIAAGIVDSVATKVAQMTGRFNGCDNYVLTGGLSHIAYFAEIIGKKIKSTVTNSANGKFAGALGAAVLAGGVYDDFAKTVFDK